jgi:carboxymethylenebutenolidase
MASCPGYVAAPHRRAMRALFSLALVASAAGAVAGGEARPRKLLTTVRLSTDTFESGEKKITREWFKPEGKGPHPAILLVHESAGMQRLPAAVFRHYGKVLAEEGYVVLLVHYFNRTDHVAVDPTKRDEIRKHFPAWRDTLSEALKLLTKVPDVDPGRVGVLGLSLGSYLSLSIAMEKKMGVAAVANLFGGLPDELWGELEYLPPLLVIGGKKDQLVPAGMCYALRGWCEENNVACECCVFKDQDHLFAGDVKKHLAMNLLNPLAILEKSKDIQETQRRVLRFFARHLRAEKAK